MDGVEEGRACCEGRRRGDGGGGDYFSGFLIQEVKLAGARAGERQAGRQGGGWRRSGRGWYRWTVYKEQRCHWHALHLLCQLPRFSHLQERTEGRKRLGSRCWQALLGVAKWSVRYLNNKEKTPYSNTAFYSIWSYSTSYFVMPCFFFHLY